MRKHWLRIRLSLLVMLGCIQVSQGAEIMQKQYVEYQGERIALAGSYADFKDYKNAPTNLSPVAVQQAERLIRRAKFGPSIPSHAGLFSALMAIQFPGYGLFYANQLGAKLDKELEIAYIEIPGGRLNRHFALAARSDGTMQVIDDFVAAQRPEIARVRRAINGALQYTTTTGEIVKFDRQ